jgi:predicted dehydrogenase
MSEGTITIAQIGCGYWGPNVLRNFSAQQDCWVKFVAEINPERQAYVRSNFPRSEVVSSLDAILNDKEVDAVIVATPASSHYALTKQVLESGKHAFVEKPLATSTTEADELVKLAESSGKTLMVGHTFLYNAAVRYAKKILSDDELGQLYYIYSQRLNLGQVRSDVNAWWNLAPHDVSILMYFMNCLCRCRPSVSVTFSPELKT